MKVIEEPHKEGDLSLKHFTFKEDMSKMYWSSCKVEGKAVPLQA
jgi:hypothetical protein